MCAERSAVGSGAVVSENMCIRRSIVEDPAADLGLLSPNDNLCGESSPGGQSTVERAAVSSENINIERSIDERSDVVLPDCDTFSGPFTVLEPPLFLSYAKLVSIINT